MNLDLIIFSIYLLLVAIVGFWFGRKEKDSKDFFLAGRNLTWWIIGGSLIAANISTHHFIGMSGQGFQIGLAIASYEWVAAIALIIYGKFFLPYYLKTKITTMPEFLENRFNQQVRLVFAIISLVGYILIELAVVLYTGSLAMQSIFGIPLHYSLLVLCVVAGGYTIWGGLKSVAYTDIIQVTVLILGGLAVTIIGLQKVANVSPDVSNTIWGGLQALISEDHEKFHMVQSWNHPTLPWVGVFFGGMWLANIFYWGCNQFITQRTLAAKNIWHGQMGVVFAGFLKLLVPILVVLPGIIAFRLFELNVIAMPLNELGEMKVDFAFPNLVKALLPAGISGLVMAGLMGAVMSTIASLLTSSSSIFTFDIYKRHLKQKADSSELMKVGRITTFIVLVSATIFGYYLRNLTAIFTYIQKFWSIAWPAVVAVFLTGFFYKRANGKGSLITMIVGPVWAILFTIAESLEIVPKLAFLNRAGIDFLFCIFIIWLFRSKGDVIDPKAFIDRTLPQDHKEFLKTIPWFMQFKTWSFIIIAIVIFLYVRFF